MSITHSQTLISSTYKLSPDRFDEMLERDGNISSHWKGFVDCLNRLGAPELVSRHQEILRLLKQNGVTYHIYDDLEGLNRQWKLDPIPLIVRDSLWQDLEQGLKQRAYLLNLLMADLYGPANIIKEGILPLELIYSDPHFLRPCHQALIPGPYQLLTYAADIAKGPDGNVWVIGDRTQAPSGWGYSLENRIVMARVMPELFQAGRIRKITEFYQQIVHYLSDFTPNKGDNPKIILLTPGPLNETYFEHAYLASFLGLTLCRGTDLMVKDGFVWLKTLSGLEKVDIIIRRVDDTFCDPLELRSDSQLGVPGLLEAARQGNVVLANPLGSGILENPALLSFMAAASRFYLSEDLKLPSIATWWCGQQQEKQYVLDNLELLVIKRIDRNVRGKTYFGWQLTNEAAQQLRREILAMPHLFVGQEQAIFSTAPAFNDQQLDPRHTVIRAFIMASLNGYQMLPGGLTRSAPRAGNTHVSNQSGGISKDTWVVSDLADSELPNPVFRVSLQPATLGLASLSSRTAENLFWVGRYAVRNIFTARMIRSVLKNLAESKNFSKNYDITSLHQLLKALTQVTMTYPGFVGEEGEAALESPEKELQSLIFDVQKIGGLNNTIQAMLRAAYAVRDRWSSDTWRVLDTIEESWLISEKRNTTQVRHIRNKLDALITDVSAFVGFNQESISNEEGRHLYDIGRKIEHGYILARMIRATLVSVQEDQVETSLLDAVLISNESLHTFRYRHRAQLNLSNVLILLLLDIKYQRSLAYSLSQLLKHLEKLPGQGTHNTLREDQRLVMEAFSLIRMIGVEELIQIEEGSYIYDKLDQLLARIAELLAQASDALNRLYFSHLESRQQIITIKPSK